MRARRPRADAAARQEPGGRQRGPAHARARAGRARPASPSSTTTSPTAATSPGSGTPTSSCSPPRVRRVTCSGTRAAELALRLKYAGRADRPDRRRARARARRSTRARRRRRRARLVRPADLHRDARAARRCSSRAAPRTGSFAMTATSRHLARRRVRRATPRTSPLWRELAAATRPARCSTSARAPGRVALDLAAPRPRRSSRWTRDAALLARAARARAARPAGRDRRSPTRATLRPRAGASASIIVPMQTVQLLGGPTGAPAFLRAAARAPAARRRCVALALADALEGFDAERRRAARCPTSASIDGDVLLVSRPVGDPRRAATGSRIERVREASTPDGTRSVERRRHPAGPRRRPTTLEAEGARSRPAAAPARRVDPARPTSTSAPTVVMLRA